MLAVQRLWVSASQNGQNLLQTQSLLILVLFFGELFRVFRSIIGKSRLRSCCFDLALN